MISRLMMRILLILLIGTAMLITACAQYTLSTSVIPSGSGTISPEGGNYNGGTELTLNATPADGYVFDHWSGDITGASGSVTLTMDSDKSTVAHFKAQYTLSTSVTPSGSGTISPEGGIYDGGTELTLDATPAEGYAFDHWSGTATGTSDKVTVIMDEDQSVTAHFIRQFTLTTDVTPEGAGKVSPSGGDYKEGTDLTLTAVPGKSYVFDRWSGDATGASNPTTVTIDSDQHIIAQFKPQYSLTISVRPDGFGEVSPTGGMYADGDKVTLTANPATGYRFDKWIDRWSGDVIEASSSVTVTMNGDKDIIAQFKASGPARVEVSIPASIPCTPYRGSGCIWDYSITVYESHGVEATVERVRRVFVDRNGGRWTIGGGDGWFNAAWVIPPKGEYEWSSWHRDSDYTTDDDLRGATLEIRYEGRDANGHYFSGFVSTQFAWPDE